MPEWVQEGVWVRRLSDRAEGVINAVEDTSVGLSFGDKDIYWRRAKSAQFDLEFEPLPEPMNRYERLMGDEVICSTDWADW